METREKSYRALYADGMKQYALCRRAQAGWLCVFAAAAGCGIAGGIFLFHLFGEHAEPEVLFQTYVRVRAFTSYQTLYAYIGFLAGWFCHHACWLLAAALCAGFCHPAWGVLPLAAGRGALAGCTVCIAGGVFSLSSVFFAAEQSACLALLFIVSVKSIRYAENRAQRNKERRQDPVRWLFAELLPFLSGVLLPLGVLLCLMLLVSAAACAL